MIDMRMEGSQRLEGDCHLHLLVQLVPLVLLSLRLKH